jgi:arylformamidase
MVMTKRRMAEAKLETPLDEIYPRDDYQIMHTFLFSHDVIHIENLGATSTGSLMRR